MESGEQCERNERTVHVERSGRKEEATPGVRRSLGYSGRKAKTRGCRAGRWATVFRLGWGPITFPSEGSSSWLNTLVWFSRPNAAVTTASPGRARGEKGCLPQQTGRQPEPCSLRKEQSSRTQGHPGLWGGHCRPQAPSLCPLGLAPACAWSQRCCLKPKGKLRPPAQPPWTPPWPTVTRPVVPRQLDATHPRPASFPPPPSFCAPLTLWPTAS